MENTRLKQGKKVCFLQHTTPRPEISPISIIKKAEMGRNVKGHFSKIKLTILHLQKVTDQVLHEAILLRHIPLEVHHLGEHVLVIVL
jgi:hypothetical protein